MMQGRQRASDSEPVTQNTNPQEYHRLLRMAVAAGIAVFPCGAGDDKKRPMIKRPTKLDTEIGADERQSIYAEADQAGKPRPRHVGATMTLETLNKMIEAYPSVPYGLSCGPSGLFVVDADLKNAGPRKLAGFAMGHGGLPAGAVKVRTQSGGSHTYFENTAGLGCGAGAMKDLGCDLRARDGYVIAPGSYIAPGRHYGELNDLKKLIFAVEASRGKMRSALAAEQGVPVENVPPLSAAKALPEVPAYIVAEVSRGGVPIAINDKAVAAIVDQVRAEDWPDFDAAFDPAVDGHDLPGAVASDPKLAALLATPSPDMSANRQALAHAARRNFVGLTVQELASLYENFPDVAGVYADVKSAQGEWDARQLGREWEKAAKSQVSAASDGSAFGIVPDEDADGAASLVGSKPSKVRPKARREGELRQTHQSTKFIVRNLILEVGTGVIFGPPNSGKSFLIGHIAACLQRGREVFGLRVKACDVLYYSAEGSGSLSSRAIAWSLHNDDTTSNGIAIQTDMPNLFLNGAKAVATICAEAEVLQAESGQRIGLIVLDTLSMAALGCDESIAHMNLIAGALKEIAERLQCCVIATHHTGKDVSRGMRGGSSLDGAVDFTIEVVAADAVEVGKNRRSIARKGASGLLHLIPRKARDWKALPPMAFTLKTVVVGKDEYGEEATSCAVVPCAAEFGPAADEDMPDVEDSLTRGLKAQILRANDKLAIRYAEHTKVSGMEKNGGWEMPLADLANAEGHTKLKKLLSGTTHVPRAFRDEYLGGAESDEIGDWRLIVAKRKGGRGAVLRVEPVEID
jgi:hypothetical protein